MAHTIVPLGLISSRHSQWNWLAADHIKSNQSRHLSGKTVSMLVKCLMETFGQSLQDISSLRPLLLRCSLVTTILDQGVHC